MRLLKTHSSKRPDYAARKTRRKATEGNADLLRRQANDQNLAGYRRVAGAGAKWKGTTAKTITYKRRTARKIIVESFPRTVRVVGGRDEKGELMGNTGAETKGSHAKNLPQPRRHSGGGDEETTYTVNGR